VNGTLSPREKPYLQITARYAHHYEFEEEKKMNFVQKVDFMLFLNQKLSIIVAPNFQNCLMRPQNSIIRFSDIKC
jgi:hypothetical protein